MYRIVCVLLSIFAIAFTEDCKPTITTASGNAQTGKLCSGNLIFEENFNTLDKTKWKPEVTFWGGGVSFINSIYQVEFNW